MITDSTYLTGPLAIEGLNTYIEGGSVTNDAVIDSVNAFISVYEDDYLHRMFGGMSGLVMDSFASEAEKDPVMAGLLRLVADTEEKRSPISGYVFFQYVRRNGASVSALGAVRPATDEGADPSVLLVQAWNLMAVKNREIDRYIRENRGYFEGKGYSPDPCMMERMNVLGL